MTQLLIDSSRAKKPRLTLGRLVDSLPDYMLQRVADPGGNWEPGAMVQMREVGDGVAEFRCLLGHDMSVAIRFDRLASRYGGQRFGTMLRRRAKRQMLLREYTAHERSRPREGAKVPRL